MNRLQNLKDIRGVLRVNTGTLGSFHNHFKAKNVIAQILFKAKIDCIPRLRRF